MAARASIIEREEEEVIDKLDCFSSLPTTEVASTSTKKEQAIHLLRCGGCQGSVVYDALKNPIHDSNHHPKRSNVIIWDDSPSVHRNLQGLDRVNSAADLVDSFLRDGQQQVICVYICHGDPQVRRSLVAEMTEAFQGLQNGAMVELTFPTVIHPTATISPTATLGKGCFVGPHSVIHTSATIGDFCIINTSCVIEHDCAIGDYCNVNPGGVLCGSARLQSGSVLGANATIRDGISVAPGSVIGMQAAVVKNIAMANCTSVGVPCRTRHSKNEKDATRNKKESINPITPHTHTPTGAPTTAFDAPHDLTEKDSLKWCHKKTFSLERYHEYLLPSLVRGHMTNDGPLQREAASKIQHFCCGSDSFFTKRVLLTASGTAALHVLASAWQMKKGKRLRWATQSFTFPSAIQGPLCDAIVVDIDEKLGGPCLKQLEDPQLLEKVDGIIVTNVFGQPANCVVYEKWCKRHEKLLLLDNAATSVCYIDVGDSDAVTGESGQQCHRKEQKRCIHDIGDGAFVSLHETKPIGRGEGGAIFVSPQLLLYAHRAMNFGFNVYMNERCAHRYASNWRMSDFAAAAICDHIDTVIEDEWVSKHEELVQFAMDQICTTTYRDVFKFHRPVMFPTILPCLFLTVHTKCDMDAVANYLLRCVPTIEAKRYYRPLGTKEETPVAWELYDKSICLPFHVGITKEMISYQLNHLFYAVTSLFS